MVKPKPGPKNAVMISLNHSPRGSPHASLSPPATRTVTVHHSLRVLLFPLPSFHPLQTLANDPWPPCRLPRKQHLLFQHPINHGCPRRLCKRNRNRAFQESLRCRDRTRKFSRGYLELLQEREKAYKDYREGNRRLISSLSPVGNVIQAFSGVLGEAVSLVSHTSHLVTLLM